MRLLGRLFWASILEVGERLGLYVVVKHGVRQCRSSFSSIPNALLAIHQTVVCSLVFSNRRPWGRNGVRRRCLHDRCEEDGGGDAQSNYVLRP